MLCWTQKNVQARRPLHNAERRVQFDLFLQPLLIFIFKKLRVGNPFKAAVITSGLPRGEIIFHSRFMQSRIDEVREKGWRPMELSQTWFSVQPRRVCWRNWVWNTPWTKHTQTHTWKHKRSHTRPYICSFVGALPYHGCLKNLRICSFMFLSPIKIKSQQVCWVVLPFCTWWLGCKIDPWSVMPAVLEGAD